MFAQVHCQTRVYAGWCLGEIEMRVQRIQSVEAVPVHMRFRQPVSDNWGIYEGSNHGIVIIRDETGEYGVGEIAFAWFGGAHYLCQEVNEQWAPLLVGKDVGDLVGITSLLDHLCSFSKRHLLARAGIEMALCDLRAKRLGVPVYGLLGGKVRDRIPLTGGVMLGSVAEMIESAEARVAEGFKELKIKVGADHDEAIHVVRRIRQAIPDGVSLRVDVNMAWNDVKLARRTIQTLFDYGVTIVEQPMHADRLEDLAWLRAHTDALILIDEGVWDVADAHRYLKRHAADLLHVYISEAGGVYGAKAIFDLAALYHVQCTLGSMPEGRVGAAATAHVAAATDNLAPYASDVRGFTGYVDDIVHEELRIEDGCLIIPDGPGLGVTVDFEKLRRLQVAR